MNLKKTISAIMSLAVIGSCITIPLTAKAEVQTTDWQTVDWSANQYVTDDLSYTYNKDIDFWRYVDKDVIENNGNNTIWKSSLGELSDNEVNVIFNGTEVVKPIESSYYEMPDNVKDYLRNGGNPNNIKMKFDVDLDIDVDEDDSSKSIAEKKAEQIFENSQVEYRWTTDENGEPQLALKMRPKFQLQKGKEYDENVKLPYIDYSKTPTLPKAQYPYSSVIFSMWQKDKPKSENEVQKHYGALEVIEPEDPRYDTYDSDRYVFNGFTYGNIGKNGTIFEGMILPNYEAGQVNKEGLWKDTIQADTLESNSIRIGQQYKSRGNLWYYTYGGAVGYSFHFPLKISFSIDDHPTINMRLIDNHDNSCVTEKLFTINFNDDGTAQVTKFLNDKKNNITIDGLFLDKLQLVSYEVVDADTGNIEKSQIADKSTQYSEIFEFAKTAGSLHKIVNLYFGDDLPQLEVKYIDNSTNTVVKQETVNGNPFETGQQEVNINYTIGSVPGYVIKGYTVLEDDEQEEVSTGTGNDVVVPIKKVRPKRILHVNLAPNDGDNGDGDTDDDAPTKIIKRYVDEDDNPVDDDKIIPGESVTGQEVKKICTTIDYNTAEYTLVRVVITHKDGKVINTYTENIPNEVCVDVTEEEPTVIVKIVVKSNRPDESEIEKDCSSGQIRFKTYRYHYVYNAKGETIRCKHTITGTAGMDTKEFKKFQINGNYYEKNFSHEDSPNWKPNHFQSGYGFNFCDASLNHGGQEGTDTLTAYCWVKIKSERISQKKYCSSSFREECASEVNPPTKVTVQNEFDDFWGFDDFVTQMQPKVFDLEDVKYSRTIEQKGEDARYIVTARIPETRITYSDSENMRRRIFTPVSLSDGNHKVLFKYSGGGINNTEFCYEFTKDYIIEGNMYENNHTFEGIPGDDDDNSIIWN